MNMTWKEFKQHIDILLEKEGISEDMRIDYIDISWPTVTVIGEEDNGMDCPCLYTDKNGISIH